MRILFAPNDLGGGLGHVNRCVALAQFATRENHHCAFILHQKHLVHWLKPDYQSFYAPLPQNPKKILNKFLNQYLEKIYPAPLFITFSNLNYQVIRDGFTATQIVDCVVKKYKKIIQTFRPDVIIGDGNLIIGIAGRQSNIPMVQLIRSCFHPDQPRAIWWEPVPKALKPPEIGPIFNPIMARNHFPPIQQAEELLTGDLYLIPSIPQIEPIQTNGTTHYVGPLLSPTNKGQLPEWFANLNPDFSLVYVTIGGGAATVGNNHYFGMLIEAFREEHLQVIISTTPKFSINQSQAIPAHIMVKQWVPGRDVISRADMVISHGGYGTLMETIAAGKPSLIIPFHTEQEGNGRRLEALGCGLVRKLSQSPARLVKQRWEYGEFTTLIQLNYDLTAMKLKEAVHQILGTQTFLENSKKLKSECNNYNGPQLAFFHIYQLIRKNRIIE